MEIPLHQRFDPAGPGILIENQFAWVCYLSATNFVRRSGSNAEKWRANQLSSSAPAVNPAHHDRFFQITISVCCRSNVPLGVSCGYRLLFAVGARHGRLPARAASRQIDERI